MLIAGGLFLSCGEEDGRQKDTLDMASLADLQVSEYALNTQNVKECLEHIMMSDHDSTRADQRLRSYYREGGELVWVDRLGADHRADTLLNYLQQHLRAHGLADDAFALRQIGSRIAAVRACDRDQASYCQQVAQAEYLLSKAYLRYAMGQRYGFSNPKALFNYHDIREQDTSRNIVVYNRLFDIEVEQPAPRYAYEALRRVLADSVGEYLRAVEPRDSVYDRLQAELCKGPDAARRNLLLVNMERRRWRMKRPDARSRYVWVNAAAQHLWAVAPDSVFSMRVVCGARRTKTPLLISSIGLVQINPEWIIPMSIIRNEVSRHAGDSAWFARHNYYITDRSSGKQVSTKSVGASQLCGGRYRVSQRGGPGNSLGRVVFRFPNDFSVYLHDTSNPGAFGQSSRALSHGCVRVQRPFDLARFMLTDPDEWLLDRLRISMGMQPESEQGIDYMRQHADETQPHKLVSSLNVNPRVPVFIDYYTFFPSPLTGGLETWADPYGYDPIVLKAIKPFL